MRTGGNQTAPDLVQVVRPVGRSTWTSGRGPAGRSLRDGMPIQRRSVGRAKATRRSPLGRLWAVRAVTGPSNDAPTSTDVDQH